MKADPEINEEDERVSMRLIVLELECKIMEEKHKFEVFKGESEERGMLLALKESERYMRELLGLRIHVRRLEEDLKTVREREMIDRERMKRLLEEMEMKDAEFNGRSLALKTEKTRAQDEAREWMNMLESLKARESVLVDEIARLKKKANQYSFAIFERTTAVNNVINIDPDDEQLPMVTEESVKRKCPQSKGQQSMLAVVGNDEEENKLKKKEKKKEFAAMAMGPKRASACVAFSKRFAVQSESSASGHAGVKEPSTVADIQTPISPVDAVQAQVMQLGHPSFTITMIKYNISACFWLYLPTEFCLENFPCCKETMILEDDEDLEYKVIYIGKKKGFSGGWRLFASAHGLKVGDTFTFELRGPTRFKVYIIKANM